MSDPPKFNFGAPASTSSSSGNSLFGTSNQGNSLFGAGNNSKGGTTFSFGNLGKPPAGSNADDTTPLFGATSNSSSGSIFGQPAGAGSIFSGLNQNKANENKSPIPSTTFSGFGNLQTPAKSSIPTSSGIFGGSTGGTPGTLFGSTTTPEGLTTPAPTASAPSFNFGGTSTTPAGPPPTSNAFGASTGTGGDGLFKLDKGSGGKASGGLFSTGLPKSAASDASAKTSTTSSAPAGTNSFTGFGNPPTSSRDMSQKSIDGPTSIFKPTGMTSKTPTTSVASPFGNTPAISQPSSSLFPQPDQISTESTASKSTFSFLNASGAPSTLQPAATSSSGSRHLFGSATTSAPSQTSQVTATSSSSSFSFAAMSGTAAASTPETTAPDKPSFFSQQPNLPSTTSRPASSAEAAATTTIGCSAAAVPTGQINSALGTSTAGPMPPSQSRLRNKTMDEILTRWASDLTKYTKEFKNHAETVARWDQILVENMDKISKLYNTTALSERQTASVEMQLTAVENQQNELNSWLTKYEREVDEMLARNAANQAELGGPDEERERTYKLAEKLGERLKDMNRDLESMIEEVNAANASLNKNSKADEPVTQIVRILNSHLTQLQAIDQGTVALQAKIAAAQRSSQRLGNMNGSKISAGSAVEDFYRSYTGKR